MVWVWPSCPTVGKVFRFYGQQILNVILNHIILTLKHTGYLKKASMEAKGKSKILINAVHEEWVGPQTYATSVQSTYTEGLVL